MARSLIKVRRHSTDCSVLHSSVMLCLLANAVLRAPCLFDSEPHQGAIRSVRDGFDPGCKRRRLPRWVRCRLQWRQLLVPATAPAWTQCTASSNDTHTRFTRLCDAVDVGDKLVICLANTLNLDGTPSAASFDAVSSALAACCCWSFCPCLLSQLCLILAPRQPLASADAAFTLPPRLPCILPLV